MSQARITQLEALLARVSARRDEPRLHVVAPASSPAEPIAAQAEPLSAAAAPAIIVVPDVPADVRVGDGAPPTPSVINALAAIQPETLISIPPAALDAAAARGPVARPSMPAPSEPEEPELALPEPEEPEEPTVAVAVPNLLRALQPELTPTGEVAVPEATPVPELPPAALAEPSLPASTLPEPTLPEPPEPAAPEPVLELVQPAALSAPEQPRVSVPPPRMSLPVRPSIPSPELVPEALPFTLLTERPPALPSEQESLELAAIALTTSAPVIDLGGAGPVRVEVQPSLSDLIEMPEVDVARVSAAVTVVPAASTTPPSGRGPTAPIIPPVLAPAIAALGGGELEPDVHAPAVPAEELVGHALQVQLPSITGSAVTVTSALQSRAPQTFGRLLARSLALRPRS